MSIKEQIHAIANQHASKLAKQIDQRVQDMDADDTSHFLIYRVLGVTEEEGRLIDVYQNKGRFLYRYAGAFLEDVTKLCFRTAFPKSQSTRVPNTYGKRPKTFEIDIADESTNLGIEIKWRDATTDGDHITKEHTRLLAVKDAGFIPVRVMFYYPNRDQAMRIQRVLESLYQEAGGEYHAGDNAWRYVREKTGIGLLEILTQLAEEGS
ncbi:MAG: ApaLI family restriction endonuclease [Myxococcales bacterium]|nr:ApaLI family restriction endonuclease [Myxococcales bacterium]